MEEHRIPSSLARIVFQSVEEHIGENGLDMFLKRAGLEEYIGRELPDDDTPSIEMDKFKKGIGLVIELFGEKAAKPLLLRWGKLTFEYALKNRPTLFGLAGLVTTFMGEEGKTRFILKRVLKESENLYDVPHILTEDKDNFYVEIQDCFYCGDLHSDNCICWPPVGFWISMMTWITGKEHEVKETECMAQGHPSCKFVIAKKGVVVS
jgi:predicted hydrocarbon binding protein